MVCGSCGQNATHVSVFYAVNEEGTRNLTECCENCGQVGGGGLADVYWNDAERTNENLCENGQPVEFLSRGHKAAWMKQKGLVEVGDRVHGAPVSATNSAVRYNKPTRQQVREQVKNAIEKAKADLRKKGRF